MQKLCGLQFLLLGGVLVFSTGAKVGAVRKKAGLLLDEYGSDFG